MIRHLLIASCLLGPAACAPALEQVDDGCTVVSETAGPEDPPVAWRRCDPLAEVELRMAEALSVQPQLRASLYEDARERLDAFAAEAPEGRMPGSAPLSMYISYGPVFETARLVAVEGSEWSYGGGAHGNGFARPVLWDKAAQRVIPLTSLFRAEADMAPADAALCKAVNAARIVRGEGQDFGPVEPLLLEKDDPDALWSCPPLAEVPFLPVVGTVDGKAGGLVIFLNQYVVGSYAEGPYTVVVPRDVVMDLLSPAYADQFAGTLSAETIQHYRGG